MISKNIKNFDLAQIADSGQIFRMNKINENEFYVISKDKFLKLSQKENKISFYCTEDDYKNYWEEFFDIKRDYEKIVNSVDKKDKFLYEAVQYGEGIRILNQDFFEMLISFIISQQNSITKIKNTVEKLCEKFGKKLQDKETGISYFAFPEAKKLSTLEDLQGLSLGYRDKYISSLCEKIISKEIILDDLKKISSYDDCKKELKKIYGVGEKVANCVLLFSLHFKNAFPIDTWIKKVIETKYHNDFPFHRYDGYLGIIQQYLFFYAKNTMKNSDKK